ncbi:extracellular solute-binding protein [Modestobacter sp. NPDC049651]|uniref:extracellular solute-binding protein n=1 Tax=unclassified Modestobacter TaxID=2643866 RepID=UPI00340040BF
MTSRRSIRVAMSATTLVLAGALVAACGSDSTSGGSGGGAATVWALQDTTLNPIEQASIDRFNKDGDGKAKLVTFANDPYKQQLRTSINGSKAPDVFFNWGGGNLKPYVDAGKIEDLTPLLDKNPELKDAFLPSVAAGAQFDGKTYGLPMRGVQPVLLFNNKKVLESAGISESPKTWDELLADVDALKAKGVTPIALAGSQSWTELMWAEYLLDRVGGPEVFQNIRDGKNGGWNQPEVVQAMTMLNDLIKRGAFGNKFQSVGYDVGGASTILATDQAGFHLMGSWEYTNQLGQSPDFVKAGNLGYGAFPAIDGGKGDPSNLVGNVSNFYSVTKDSKSKDAALDYVAKTVNDPTYVSDLIKAGDVMPLKNARDQIAKTDNADYGVAIFDMTSNAKNFQLSWDQDLKSDEATKMLTELSNLFNGKQTPEGFVKALAG